MNKNFGVVPMSVFILLVVVLLVWAVSGGRPMFRNSSSDLKTSVQNVGDDVKAAGRDVASSIRRTVE